MQNTDFPDRVAKLCLDHYSFQVSKSGKPRHSKEWTLLSAIVMSQELSTNDLEPNLLKVIALATGTKCIGQSKMNSKGAILNDCHAEVLARRALLRFLYQQLHFAIDDKPSIFVNESANGKFRIKQGIEFHLFSSNLPCGDAAIFPKCESDSILPDAKRFKGEDNNVSKDTTAIDSHQIINDIYRTGAKCTDGGLHDSHLPGANYHITGALRTKPGRGHPTLSMCCSDKIAKWNVLGIQGTLLSHFLDPIYLSTITISRSPYSEEALRRAVIDRSRAVTDLPNSFRKAAPLLHQSRLEFPHSKEAVGRQNSSITPSSAAIIWSDVVESNSLEVAVNGRKQGVTAKHLDTPKARCAVCKYELLKMFKSLVHKINTNEKLSHYYSYLCSLKTYNECKRANRSYQTAREMFYNIFTSWTKKPIEMTEFQIDSE